MHTLQIIILGIVQGIAEFLPISSSAHLIIFRDVFGIGLFMGKNLEFTFDVALHLGTLLAIVVVFFNDFIKMISEGLTKGVKTTSGKLFWAVVVATIPAAIAGLLFEDVIEDMIRSNYIIIALALIVMGIIIYYADKLSKSTNSLKNLTLKEALIIGCSQVLALIPGFSRSGTTIASARVLKLNREDAAKFSFYLSAPVVLGAVILKLVKKSTWVMIFNNLGIFLIGILSSFVMGLICIKFLLKYLKKHDFKVFMIYRIVLAIIVILLVLIK